MNKEEIKYVKTENGYKFSMPLITKDELEKIDFNFNSIVDEYIKVFNNKREKTIEQRLIYDLQQELNKKNKIIEEIKEYVKDDYYDDYIYGSHILDKIEELEKGSESNE